MTVGLLLLPLFLLWGADGTHIVGGRDAASHSRPYMASLQAQGRHICGGALIKEDFVLTAAHCQIPIAGMENSTENDFCGTTTRPYTVVLGVDSLTANESTKQEFRAVRSIPHPNYDGHRNDIMLLQLDRRALLTGEVQLIALKTGRLSTASQCITAGWGDIGDNKTLPNTLQEVNVTTLSDRACRRRWGRGRVPISRSMVCGVGGRLFQGFCSGDSGGPLLCDGAAAGVVSFSGRRCGDPRTPDVYTRVSSFADWIRNTINS